MSVFLRLCVDRGLYHSRNIMNLVDQSDAGVIQVVYVFTRLANDLYETIE